ncbi:ABC transporter substrate-binding protein [Spirochaetia bacterium]|nr:ABC transporter substrate-binding protein [Spirochaetia bacterium]GHV86746.1 ABC transporter substrate-binding protein [Spirochaetia bacterium]
MNARKLIFVLVLLLAAGTLFAGGGTQNSGSAASNGKQTLVIGMQTNPYISDYKNNYLTKLLEEKFNINIEFYMLPVDAGELRTKVALMVSSNDLPDVISTSNALTGDQILDYGSKGAFIPLNKYLDDPAKTPYFAKILPDDKANIIRTTTSADGNIYVLARFEPDIWNQTPYRYYINQAWIDQLGLKTPTTTDELRNVLIAFRDRDPNGNGRKDEIGITGQFSGGYGENVIAALINSFVFWNPDNLALDAAGNKVIAPFTDPAFRQAIVYLNGLFKDGVLAPSIFTNNQQEFRATLNSTPPVVGLTTAGSWGNWSDTNNNKNFVQLKMIAPLKGPGGIAYTPYQDYVPALSTVITSKCKNPDLAMQIFDYFYEYNMSLTVRYGEEEADWTQRPEDLGKVTNAYVALGLFPKLTKVLLTDKWSEPYNKTWHNNNPRYTTLEVANTTGSYVSPYDGSLPTALLQAYNYQLYIDKHPRFILPQLKYTVEETQKIAEPVTNINEYVRQSIAEFVTGARDVNTGWDGYIRELNNMGLQTWLGAAQSSYDRQQGR